MHSPLSYHKTIILSFDNPSSYSRTYNLYWKHISVLIEDVEICQSVISINTFFFPVSQHSPFLDSQLKKTYLTLFTYLTLKF